MLRAAASAATTGRTSVEACVLVHSSQVSQPCIVYTVYRSRSAQRARRPGVARNSTEKGTHSDRKLADHGSRQRTAILVCHPMKGRARA